MKTLARSIDGRDFAARGMVLGSILWAGSIGIAGDAFGNTLSVPANYPTIQGAIDAAVDGDVIKIKAGTYQPAATIDTLGKTITIQGQLGPDGSRLVTIDGGNVMTPIQCTSGEKGGTLIENLIITNGRSSQSGGGMLLTNSSSPTVYNCAFIGNFSDCNGGGVASINAVSQSCCNPAFVSCLFEGNETLCDGGGFYTDGGNCAFIYCDFKSNHAVFGGGLHDLAGISVLYGCNFECNEAIDGGAMHLGSNALATITACRIKFNSAFGTGGGIFFSSIEQAMDVSVVCGNTPDQTVGVYTDGGGNAVSANCLTCPDINQDGIVDVTDLGLLLGSWGICTSVPCAADFDGNGVVDVTDLSYLLSFWGPCPGCS